MAVLTLKILGGFEARRLSGEVVEIPVRKGQALLAFLALNPGRAIARSRLAGLLWGDHGDKQARTSLRQTLTALRKALRPVRGQVLRADRLSVGLDGAGVDVDALSFQELIAGGTPAELEAAVSLYRGDLLEGLDLPEAGFQAWLEEERRRLHDLMAGALGALMAQKRADGDPQEAIVLGQRLLTLDPLREDVHRALMLLHAELGQRPAALRQYRRCRELLAGELDVEPETKTEALYQTLLKGDRAGAGPAEARDVIVLGRRDTGGGLAAARYEGPRRPIAAMAGVLQGSRRRAVAAGRILILGGVAALSWLLAWGYSAVQSPPDILAFLKIDALSSDDLSDISDGVSKSSRPAAPDHIAPSLGAEPPLAAASIDDLSGVLDGVFNSSGPAGLYRLAASLSAEPSLVVASIDDLSGVLDGVSESSGPARPDRTAPSRPAGPSLAVASFDDLTGVLAGVTDYSSSIVPAGTGPGDAERRRADEDRLAMQREADALWPELADSWDLRAARAFRARYPEATQVAEADLRIAFLTRRHREAQAGLNRLGYEAGPVDGIWGARSARAMRAFESENGLAPDGVVSQASFERLNTATPETATPAIPAAEAQPQPVRAGPEAAVVPPSARDGIPDGSRWTASGRSREGSEVMATATRRGDSLKVMFDIDHRNVARSQPYAYFNKYSQSCTASLADRDFDCWITGIGGNRLSARVSGTFPRLRLSFRKPATGGPYNYTPPGDIILDFSRAQKTEISHIATAAATILEPQRQPIRSGPEIAVAYPSAPDGIPKARRWTASGEADGSRIFATATRRGDTMKMEFDVDHRYSARSSNLQYYFARYSQSCTVSVADPVFDCWITGFNGQKLSAHIVGTFPKLRFSFWKPPARSSNYAVPGEIVLEFSPEPRVALE